MGSLNLEGSWQRRCSRARRRSGKKRACAAPTHGWTRGFRGHTWHETVTDSGAQAKMKAAVFAALATTAAAFAPVARPLAAAAATKLSVVPETVAELPSMLTALPTLTAPQEGELFFTSPFFVAFFVLSSAFGWPVLAALRLNSLEEHWWLPRALAPRRRAERSSCRINLILHV